MKKSLKVLLSAIITFTLVMSSLCSAYAASWWSEGSKQAAKWQQNDEGRKKGIEKKFKDLEKDFWAYQAIQELVNRGIISGYPDETFKPESSITRSEFATMLTKALKLTSTDNIQTFTDVLPSSWDYNAVEASSKYLTGYKASNGALYFYGSKNAVREDMAVALVKALGLTVETDNGQLAQVFSDYSQISANLRDYAYTAYKNGIMIGSNGKFSPQDSLTRAEAATLLIRALQKTEKVIVDGSDGQKVVVNPGSANTALYSLMYNGITVPNFNQDTLIYNVVLPSGTTVIPAVTAAVYDTSKATVYVTQATALPGYATIVVTPLDGSAQRVYSVNFTVGVRNTDATLSNLTYNGTTVTGFNSSTLSYNVVLPAGTTTVPLVLATVNDTGKAAAYVTQASGLPGYASVVVTAQDGTTQKTYSVYFTVAAKNTDAKLSNLMYNGISVPGFNADTLSYNVVLAAGTTAIPAVTPIVNDIGKATAYVTQATSIPGYATVVVTAQDGTTQRIYTIHFIN